MKAVNAVSEILVLDQNGNNLGMMPYGKAKELAEQENLEREGKKTSTYLEILSAYIPAKVSEEEIKNWIDSNIDFSQYKNKMQAMKPIMTHFGSTADGNVVKQILQKM